jgi:hypothetical protein
MRQRTRDLLIGVAAVFAAVPLFVPIAGAAEPTPDAVSQQQLNVNQSEFATQEFQRRLDQQEINTRVLANTAIPPDQRMLIDYGAYLQLPLGR